MITLIISLAIGAVAWVGSSFLFSSVAAGIVPFLVFFVASMILITRKMTRKVMAIMKKGEEIMQNVAKLPSEQARTHMLDKAVDEIKKGYAYKNYVFFLEPQLNAQVGQIYYVQRRFDEAEPYLANSFPQQSMSVCMYACLLFRRKDEAGMVAAFEKAFKYTRRAHPVLWNLYAWCMYELKGRDAAIAVLNRGVIDNPNDKITHDNLNALKNSEKGKVNMRGFNELWYQFWLDDMPMQSLQKAMLDKHSVVRSR